MSKDKAIAIAFRKLWESIDSHLPDYDCAYPKDRFHKDKKFHKQCVKDYIEIMKTLSEFWK